MAYAKGTLGSPIYNKGDRVKFEFKGTVLSGKVKIVDAFGTIEQHIEPSYDIEAENALYKHFPESDILGIAEEPQISRKQLNYSYSNYWRELRLIQNDLENLNYLDPAAKKLYEHVKAESKRVSEWLDDDWWAMEKEDPEFVKATPSERAIMDQADEELSASIYSTEEEVWTPELPDMSAAYEAIEYAAKNGKPVVLPPGTELKAAWRWDRYLLVEDLFWVDERGITCRAVLQPEIRKGKNTGFLFPDMYVVICVTEDGFSSGNTKIFRKENRKE